MVSLSVLQEALLRQVSGFWKKLGTIHVLINKLIFKFQTGRSVDNSSCQVFFRTCLVKSSFKLLQFLEH